ncbi:MAG: hypothetical protein L6R42_005721, partial [Xanthoria sp. 1 TBL-2021]
MPNDNTPLRNRLFQYICPVACDSFEALDPHSNPSPYRQVSIHREALVENCQYRIHCDFSHVMAPSGHRITGFIPGAITAFDVMSTIMPILVLYYLVCFGFTCIPVFTHSAGAFPKGWLALIAF